MHSRTNTRPHVRSVAPDVVSYITLYGNVSFSSQKLSLVYCDISPSIAHQLRSEVKKLLTHFSSPLASRAFNTLTLLSVSLYLSLQDKLMSLMRIKTEGGERGKRQREGGRRKGGGRSNQMWLCPAVGNDKVEQLCMKAVTLTVASPLLLIC